MHRSCSLYTGSYPNYVVGKLEYSSINSVQIVNYNDLICVKSLIYFNTTILSNPNSLILTFISLLVCKSDHIPNPTFYALVNLGFTYYFINTAFTQKYNIPTIPTGIIPVKLKNFDGSSNNIISEVAFLPITFLSSY